MSVHTIRITHPSNGTYIEIIPADMQYSTGNGNDPAALTLSIPSNFATLAGSSALTEGSTVAWTRDSIVEFRGRAKILRKDEATQAIIEVECLDKWDDVRRTAAGLSGLRRFERASKTAELTDMPLELLTAPEGLDAVNAYPMFPAFSTATDTPDSTSPWISKASARTVTLESAIPDGTDLTAFEVNDIRLLTFPCWLQIEDELLWIAFGYIDSGTHYVKPAERGALGTTGAAHTGVTCYQRVLKTISNEVMPRITKTGGRIGSDEFTLRETAHRFDFHNDPTGYVSITATGYYVYDVDDASDGLTVADVASDLLQETKANLGPELAGGQIDVTGLDPMFVTRAIIDNMTNGEAIERLLDESWSQQSGNSRAPVVYYEPNSDDVVIKSAKQQSTADYTFLDFTLKRESSDITNIHSAVIIQHWTNEPSNPLSRDRIWHPTVGDQADHAGSPGGGTTALIDAIMYQDFERQLATGWQADTATSSNNIYTEKLLDYDPSTGWGIRCEGDMWSGGAACHLLFLWFTEPQVIDYVEMTLDLRSFIEGTALIELVGIESYTPGDPPTWSGVVGLGCAYHMANASGDKNEYRPNHWIRDTRGSR